MAVCLKKKKKKERKKKDLESKLIIEPFAPLGKRSAVAFRALN